eukprot:COSAG02_NODE_45_length_45811_cov_83.565891_20_plen_1562_part_00
MRGRGRVVEGGARGLLVCCVCVVSVGSQDPPPHCQLDSATFQKPGYEGGTLFRYPETDDHSLYCHLDSSLCPGGNCVVPDDQACLVNCTKGYYDSHMFDTMQLHCKPTDAGHLPVLDYDFSCTGAPSTAPSRLSPSAASPPGPRAHASMLCGRRLCPAAACDQGRYKDEVGNGQCASCPEGTGTAQPGATDASECSVCAPGYNPSGEQCAKCPVGKWKVEPGNGRCTPCAEGTTTEAVGAVSEGMCSVCTPGYTPGHSGVACAPCPAGTYKQGNGTAACASCPGRTWTPGTGASSPTDCSTCQEGYDGPSCDPKACRPRAASEYHSGCAAGYYGGPQCTVACDSGWQAQSGSGVYSCNATGAWQPEGGELRCGRSLGGKCPAHDVAFPLPADVHCDRVHIVGVAYAGDKNITEDVPKSEQWKHGLEWFAAYANKQGGLRMGQGKIGYVDVKIHPVDRDDKDAYVDKYVELCGDADVEVLVGPLDSSTALAVLQTLKKEGCEKLFLLASSGIDAVFDPSEQFTHAWSVYGKASQRGADVVDFLATLDPSASQSVAIAGENTELAKEWLTSLHTAIDSSSDLTLENVPDLADTARFPRTIKPAADVGADIFIGLGDTFEALLRKFKTLKYAPSGAFLAGALDVSEYVKAESYNQPNCKSECWVPDQWMGTLPWSHEMKHRANESWSELLDRYHDAEAGANGVDRRFSRYMGSATDFRSLAKEHLGPSKEPTHYHAQAAATLLMMQMAIELAPSADGWGLSYDDLTSRNVDALKAAMAALNVHTFWGPIRLQAEGHNAAFKTGIAQVTQQDADTAVNLVGAPPARRATFPAEWPCELQDNCHPPPPPPTPRQAVEQLSTELRDHKGEVAAVFLFVILPVVACICWCDWCKRGKSAPEESVLRESLLGGVEHVSDSPQSKLKCNLTVAFICWTGCMLASIVAAVMFHQNDSLVYNVLPAVLTLGMAMPAAWIVASLRLRLEDPEHIDDEIPPKGTFGLVMVILGLLGAGFHGIFCISLWQCRQKTIVLFVCAASSSAVTLATTVYLIICMRSKLLENDGVANWYRTGSNSKLAVFIMFVACLRLDAMALLRLKLCSRDKFIVECPMKMGHYQWIRYAGIYHCILEDLVYMILAAIKCTAECAHGDNQSGLMGWIYENTAVLWIYENTAVLRIVISGILLVANMCEKSGHWLAHVEAQRGAHLRQSVARDEERAHDALERQGIAAHVQPTDGQVFSNQHVHLLRPNSWRQQIVGRGAFGIVYKATWEARDVAVKELVLPVEPHGASTNAKQMFAANIRTTKASFVKEVKLLAKHSHHDNVVHLLGWADEPNLYIVLEYCNGRSLHDQLYVEGWRPAAASVLDIAHGVAKGMVHLHTAFENPVIHRDLKSANLMLTAPPCEDDETCSVKITDFGLTREVCESVMPASTIGGGAAGTGLWMAPELVNGEDNYDEKVDVFSYAMCLIELVSCKTPWKGSGLREASIPFHVVQGKRPQHQLEQTNRELRQLVEDCWGGDPSSRPAFCDIEIRVQTMIGGASAQPAMRLATSRPASPGLDDARPQDLEGGK